jgi:copper oxidase (laccase) domain-containing protein
MSICFKKDLLGGRFETWMEKPQFPFHHVTQVHGTEIVSLETLPAEADGIMVSWEDIDHPLVIKTADCLPIVFEGEKGVVFLHAGWRGLSAGILERPEIALLKPQKAFIGPCIHDCCFEVSVDFKQNFKGSESFKELNGKIFFDLVAEAKKQLNFVYPELIVEIAPLCTCCHNTLHSYRRNKTPHRNWNVYIKG